VLPIIVLLINTFLSVLIYKEVARDWLNDPLATIKKRFEKVPIPVQIHFDLEYIKKEAMISEIITSNTIKPCFDRIRMR